VNVGVAAHITAAAANGPRFTQTLSPEERASADNGIWLCQTCAKLVDNDETRFPPDVLFRWKLTAEEAASNRVGKPAADADDAASSTARSRFIAVFAEALGALRAGNGDPFNVLAVHRKAHDAAIVELRFAIRPDLRNELDEATVQFKTLRDQTQPGILRFYEREVTGHASGATGEDIVRAIERLVACTER